MVNLGNFRINDYVTFLVQAHDSAGNAANLDTVTANAFDFDVYKCDPAANTDPAKVSLSVVSFDQPLDSKTGLYFVRIQLEAGDFSEGMQYYVRVGGGKVDEKTPATLYYFTISASNCDANLVSINGESISDDNYNASIQLKSLDIRNTSGKAFIAMDDYTP